MAPTPGDGGDDFDYFGSKQLPPDFELPTVVTSTYTYPDHTNTVAFLVVPYPFPSPTGFYTSVFTDLAQASIAAASLSQVAYGAGYQAPAAASQTGNSNEYTPTTAAEENSPTANSYTTAVGTSSSVTPPPNPQEHHGPPSGMMAVMVGVPIFFILATIAICLCCVRHYKRKARIASAVEMAARNQPEMTNKSTTGLTVPSGINSTRDERAYLAPPTAVVPPTSTSSPVRNSTGAGSEQPVILSTTMNNGFYTGIDTSDHVSISDQRSEASADTFGEEPPPPYRPRSVPPISRDTSLRTLSPAVRRNISCRSSRNCEGTSFIRRSNEVRSPFDDPEEEDEDDAMSDVSTIRESTTRRHLDDRSDVSDLSYQRDPPSSHSAI